MMNAFRPMGQYALSGGPLAELTKAYFSGFSQASVLWSGLLQSWAETLRHSQGSSVGDISIYFPLAKGFGVGGGGDDAGWGWLRESATAWPEVEEEVVRRVASYGERLDLIADLLLEVASRVPDMDPAKIDALEAQAARIQEVRRKHGRD